MKFQHKQSARDRWQKFSLVEQLANIGAEAGRTINWRNKTNQEYSDLAFERTLELFDLTLMDQKNRWRLKEIARARELFVDYIAGDNLYHSTDKQWENYFYPFNYLARLGR